MERDRLRRRLARQIDQRVRAPNHQTTIAYNAYDQLTMESEAEIADNGAARDVACALRREDQAVNRWEWRTQVESGVLKRFCE